MRITKRYPVLTVCLVTTLAAGVASAQSTFATITGSVTDPNGAMVPGVTLEATHAGTNYKYSARSNDAGQYTLANLLDGTYTLRATAAGFQEFVVRNIELSGRDVRRIDVKLLIGQVQQTVEVTAGATLIETESARIGDVKDRTVLTQLPLTLRRSWDYFQLTPTISKPRGGWYIRFAGSRNRQGDVSFDGASIASIWGGPINGVLTDRTEGYQEMRVDSAGNSAEFAGIGQISIVTRAGTNELHGSAFNYYTSPGMLARNPFSAAATGSVEHVPGGSLGGPVYIPKIYDGRNRTFFYATIEFERFGSPSVGLFNPTVPLAAWRKGDFSALLPGTVVRDPMARNAPFAGNLIPTTRLNPVTTKLQDRFFPLPNYGDASVLAAQNYRQTVLVEKEINPTLTLRFDHRFSEQSFVYARVTKVDWIQKPWQGAFPTIGRNDGHRYSRASTITYAHTIRPTLLSETRWGYSSDNSPRVGPVRGLQLVQELGLQGLAPNLPDMTGMFNVSFSGIGLAGLSGSSQCDPCNFTPKHVFEEKPYNIAEPSFTNPADNPTVILPVVFPSTGTGGPSTVSIPGAINPDIRVPYSMQYTATVEHQRWDTGFRLSYVGTNTRKGVWSYDINSPVADSRPYVDKPRLFPRYPGVSYVTNGAGHQYNSMTLEAKRTTRGGLHYQIYYTLARDIGDLEDGEMPEYAYDRKRERAVWSDIPTHRFSANAIYDLPFGKGKKFGADAPRAARALIGDWQLGVIVNAENGFFLTPGWTGPDPTGTRYTASRTPASTTIRPNILREPHLAGPTPARWFDASAFEPPSAGSFGTSAKGVIKGPGTQVMHATIAKHIPLGERARLRLEFNATNALNHPNYVDPDTNISNRATVGTINNVVNRNSKMDMAIPRYLQLIVRLEW